MKWLNAIRKRPNNNEKSFSDNIDWTLHVRSQACSRESIEMDWNHEVTI